MWKWSVSVDQGLASQVELHVLRPKPKLGSIVARSVEYELEHDTLSAYLDAHDEEFGPVPSDLVDKHDGRWPS